MELFSNFINLILELINQLGILGIFLGMTIESSFIPFPSEIILIPAGALIAQNKMQFIPVLISAILGSLLGAYINYILGFYFGRKTINKLAKKYGKFLLITEEKLQKTDEYFKNHGKITTLLARFIPAVRQLISIPAGFSKMNFKQFTIYTAIGSGIWSTFLILMGMFAANNIKLLKQNQFLIYFTILILIIFYITLQIKKSRKHHS